VSVDRAFDEARFGRERTLNLRAHLPTGEQAAEWVERWLRERQVAKSEEVLIVTGRGNSSEGGVPVVREAVARRLASLRRRNVVASVVEHTPGAFVVRLAPLRALFEVPKRRREPTVRARQDPSALAGLSAETLALLRRLALHSLDVLGVRRPGEKYVREEILRQFVALSAALPEEGNREAALRQAIARTLDEYEAL
jgi:hypothetical protein